MADFTSAVITDLGDDRVEVRDVRGTPATDTYKALLAYPAGWAGETRIAFSWPDAAEKAKALAAIFMKRVEMAGLTVDDWEVELWGVNALGGDTVPPPMRNHQRWWRASRGDAPINAPRPRSGASSCPWP